MGTSITVTSGQAISKPLDLMPTLTRAEEGSILFIDEIHRLPRLVQEFLYPVMEDFRADVVLGHGPSARAVSVPLKHFTLIGATTRSGFMSSPMRDRFRIHENLEFYSADDLTEVVLANASKLSVPVDEDAARFIAKCSRGTPRDWN